MLELQINCISKSVVTARASCWSTITQYHRHGYLPMTKQLYFRGYNNRVLNLLLIMGNKKLISDVLIYLLIIVRVFKINFRTLNEPYLLLLFMIITNALINNKEQVAIDLCLSKNVMEIDFSFSF